MKIFKWIFILCLLFQIGLARAVGGPIKKIINKEEEIIHMVVKSAMEKGVDPYKALAFVKVESKFNPKVKPLFEPKYNTWSVGLFQVFLPTARAMGFEGLKTKLSDKYKDLEVFKENDLNDIKIIIKQYEKVLGRQSDPLNEENPYILLNYAKSLEDEIDIQKLQNPKVNAKYGLKYIQGCVDIFGNDIRKIACCYNAGKSVKESVCTNNKKVKKYISDVEAAYYEMIEKGIDYKYFDEKHRIKI